MRSGDRCSPHNDFIFPAGFPTIVYFPPSHSSEHLSSVDTTAQHTDLQSRADREHAGQTRLRYKSSRTNVRTLSGPAGYQTHHHNTKTLSIHHQASSMTDLSLEEVKSLVGNFCTFLSVTFVLYFTVIVFVRAWGHLQSRLA